MPTRAEKSIGVSHGKSTAKFFLKEVETMKKIENNTGKINTEAVKEQVQELKLSPYATNAMRPLIIQKSLDGQRRAINLDQVEDAGLTKSTFDEWCYNVDSLYEAALDYSKSIGTESENEDREELWKRWRTIIRVGEEDPFHKNMFVREKDVENLRVLAAESDEIFIDGIGFVPSVKGKLAFRSKIEIRLACRIAGNATLNDEERQILLDYRKAERTIKQCEDLLNGYIKGKDVIPGLETQITGVEKELEEKTAELSKLGVKDVAKYTRRLTGEVKTLREQKISAEKRLKKANAQKAELQEKYDSIINRLDSIESAR